jgi:hypothetical protein
MFGGAGPLHTILSRDMCLALFERVGRRIEDADEATAVDHFEVPIAGQATAIQTQFLTASR